MGSSDKWSGKDESICFGKGGAINLMQNLRLPDLTSIGLLALAFT